MYMAPHIVPLVFKTTAEFKGKSSAKSNEKYNVYETLRRKFPILLV